METVALLERSFYVYIRKNIDNYQSFTHSFMVVFIYGFKQYFKLLIIYNSVNISLIGIVVPMSCENGEEINSTNGTGVNNVRGRIGMKVKGSMKMEEIEEE